LSNVATLLVIEQFDVVEQLALGRSVVNVPSAWLTLECNLLEYAKVTHAERHATHR
jgi:hypothetical protein